MLRFTQFPAIHFVCKKSKAEHVTFAFIELISPALSVVSRGTYKIEKYEWVSMQKKVIIYWSQSLYAPDYTYLGI